MIFKQLFLLLIPFYITHSQQLTTSSTRRSSTSTTSSNYELPTLFLDTDDYRIYYANVTIGSADQHFNLRIDLIQSETWVMDSRFFITCNERYTSETTNQSALHHLDVNYTAAVANLCATQGLYNISLSNSSSYFSDDYQATNQSTSLMQISSEELNFIRIDGIALQDNFYFDNLSILLDNMNFISANYSNVMAGGLGLLLDGIGNNFLQSLVNNDLANVSSYSLYLGRLENNELQLNLGGLDTSKIKGDFVEFDFIPYVDANGDISNNVPIVPLTGMSVTSGGTGLSLDVGEFDQGIYPLLLDSRTYYSYLPYDAVIDLLLQMNAYYSSDLERWLVDCSVGQLAATVNFKFGNLTINIPLSELIYIAYDDDDNVLTFHDTGASACFISVLPQEDEGMVLLGTPFLRNIYLAVDNAGRKLAMAELYVELYDGGQSIEEIIASESSASLLSVLLTMTSSSLAQSDKVDDVDTKTSLLSLTSATSVSTTQNTARWGTTKTMIRSGHIPFASPNNISSYEELTLSQSDLNITRTPSSGDVIIANGEIVFTSSTQAATSSSFGSSGYSLISLTSSSSSTASSMSTVGAGNVLVSNYSWIYSLLLVIGVFF